MKYRYSFEGNFLKVTPVAKYTWAIVAKQNGKWIAKNMSDRYAYLEKHYAGYEVGYKEVMDSTLEDFKKYSPYMTQRDVDRVKKMWQEIHDTIRIVKVKREEL